MHKRIDREHLRVEHELFEIFPECAQFLLGPAVDAQPVAVEHRVVQRRIFPLGIFKERLHRLFPDPAAGNVDDARHRFGVKRIARHPQIGENVLDLLALEELETAEDLVRDPVFGELLLVRAGQGVDAHENGKIGETVSLRPQGHDRLCAVERLARLVLRLVPDGFFPLGIVRVKGLSLAARIVRDGGIRKR